VRRQRYHHARHHAQALRFIIDCRGHAAFASSLTMRLFAAAEPRARAMLRAAIEDAD